MPKDKLNLKNKKKVAFVCSGGATKAGAFHLGVALALQEKGFIFSGGLRKEGNPDIRIDRPAATASPSEEIQDPHKTIQMYVGSSAGSVIASYLGAGHDLDLIFDAFLGRKPKPGSGVKALRRLTYSTMFSLRGESGRPESSLLGSLGAFRDLNFGIPSISKVIDVLLGLLFSVGSNEKNWWR